MGAMVPPPQWIPEDDVLLKNAVECGASLESLAKGAVQFSRRYTVKELQDRWCSLLYDPVVAMEASPHMFEVVRSGFLDQPRPSKFESVKETPFTPGKRRKAESIRKCYYAMRKRICSEPFDMMGINLLYGPSTSNFGDVNGHPSGDGDLGIQGPNFDLGPHSLSEFGPHATEDLQLDGNNVSRNLSFPYKDNNLSINEDQSKDLPLYDLFEPEGLGNEGNACPDFGEGGPIRKFACSSSSMPQLPMWDDTSPDISLPTQIREPDQETGSAFRIPPSGNANETEDYLAELSNTLFDDDLLFIDNNGKEGIDKSYYDGFSSLLLDSPSQSGLPSGQPEVTEDGHLLDNEHKVADTQVATSTFTLTGLGPEYCNGVICCTLNTEDPEIPSNDDVFLPFRFPSPATSPGGHLKMEDSSYLVASSVKGFSSTRKANGGPTMNKKTHKDSRVMESSQSSDKVLKYPIGDKGVKIELPKSSIQHAALRNNAKNGEGHLSRISSANVTANRYIGEVVKTSSLEMDWRNNLDHEPISICLDKNERDLDVQENQNNNNNNFKAEISNVESPNGELSCQKMIDDESRNPIDESWLSDQEDLSESDVPYFSDVEHMILDMDLSPDEFDLYTIPEVQRYLLEESKRTIIRLEQAAHACTQRAIANQGAFAVLYGRCSKHFIKKPEVILGRETEENKVDIDLGRGKNGGKTSRRQAIIKMDMHGIFQLINIGKSSVQVNGKELVLGQSLSLNSGCLIEVRGLAFIFETNSKRVNQYINSIVVGRLPLDHRPSNGS
ncbi:hypothetical protein OROMI_030341 [Orobanche minor]